MPPKVAKTSVSHVRTTATTSRGSPKTSSSSNKTSSSKSTTSSKPTVSRPTTSTVRSAPPKPAPVPKSVVSHTTVSKPATATRTVAVVKTTQALPKPNVDKVDFGKPKPKVDAGTYKPAPPPKPVASHTTAHKSEPKPKVEIIWDTSLGIGGSSKTKTSTHTTSKPSTSSGSKTTTSSTAHSSSSHTSSSSSSGLSKHTISSSSTSSIFHADHYNLAPVLASTTLPSGINIQIKSTQSGSNVRVKETKTTIKEYCGTPVTTAPPPAKTFPLPSEKSSDGLQKQPVYKSEHIESVKISEKAQAMNDLPTAISAANNAYNRLLKPCEEFYNAIKEIDEFQKNNSALGAIKDGLEPRLISDGLIALGGAVKAVQELGGMTGIVALVEAGSGAAALTFTGIVIAGTVVVWKVVDCLDNLIKYGLETSTLKENLKSAHENLTKAATLFNAKNSDLFNTIEKAGGEMEGAEIEYPADLKTIKRDFKLSE